MIVFSAYSKMYYIVNSIILLVLVVHYKAAAIIIRNKFLNICSKLRRSENFNDLCLDTTLIEQIKFGYDEIRIKMHSKKGKKHFFGFVQALFTVLTKFDRKMLSKVGTKPIQI